MERATTWRSSLRARWLGWTLVFGLLFIVLTLVSAALAWTGVRVGQRREEDDFWFRGGDRSDDDSRYDRG